MPETLKVIRCPGINTDSLGSYLVGLGLISALASRWPLMRCCWIENEFVMLSDEIENLDEVTEYLRKVWKPTQYKHWWTTSQKADTKAKSSQRIWSERNECPASEVAILDARY